MRNKLFFCRIQNDIVHRIKNESNGFITTDEDMKELVATYPHQMLLVRCGSGRFLCPAQDADHFIKIIAKEGSDYVRDVSFPAGT